MHLPSHAYMHMRMYEYVHGWRKSDLCSNMCVPLHPDSTTESVFSIQLNGSTKITSNLHSFAI